MHVKDRKVIVNSQHGITKLHFSSVITYYDETAGSVNWGTAKNVIYFPFLKTFTSITWQISCNRWSVRWLDWLDF